MGWSFPWASSFGSDFNYDFQVAYSEEQRQSGAGEYNFRPFDFSSGADLGNQRPFIEWAATTGTDWATYTEESPGISAFALDEGVGYHTYSAYARGLDGLWGMSNGSTELRSGAMRNGPPTTRSTSSVAMTSTTASDFASGPANDLTAAAPRLRFIAGSRQRSGAAPRIRRTGAGTPRS